MEPTIIYQDEKRTITMDTYGRFLAKNVKGQSRYVDLADEATRLSDTLPKGTAEVIRQRGDDPTGWYTLVERGQPRAVLPPESRQAMRLAIATAQAERRQALNDPANVARRQVSALFAQAARLHDEPGRYFPALIAAEQALKAWQAKYPQAARQERQQLLIAAAEDLERQAHGALIYDADGSLSAQDQQASYQRLMAEAAAKRAEAAHLAEEIPRG